MYMLIPMDFIILVNYVYVDSNESYNTWKLRICWFYWVLNACKLCVLILLGFWILVNYVYADYNGFYNACKLCICWFQWINNLLVRTMYMLIPMFSYNTWKLCDVANWVFVYLYMLIPTGFWMLVNYVYVDSNGFWILVNYVHDDSMKLGFCTC